MKKLVLLLTIITSVLLWSCGNQDSKKNSTTQKAEQSNVKTEKKEPKIPAGYPAELTVPPGFRASQINSGTGTGRRTIKKDGSISFGEEQAYKSYEIWKMNPSNSSELISHYKKLMTDLNYTGKWNGDDKSVRGVFKKGLNELEIKISSEKFNFLLKIWEK
jgi:hypothetical protein